MRRQDMSAEDRARYDAEVAERDKAAKRAWNTAHPEYRRAWNAAHRPQINAREHERQRRKRATERKHQAALERGRRYRAENRDRERARSRRFREQHPDQVREYARRYRERHPERAAEQQRLANVRYRDAHAAELRELGRRAAAQRREEQPDAYRQWYQANLEQQRQRSRDASRLRSRLKALGLPPPRTHRTYASDERTHQHAADAFFARTIHQDPTLAERLAVEAPASGPVDRTALWRARRATSDELTPRRLVERFERMSAAYRLRARLEEELEARTAQIERTRGAQVREEVLLDAVAGNGRRGPPFDIDAEVARRIGLLAADAVRRSHRADAQAAQDAVIDAIISVQTDSWWDTATRHDLAELRNLAHNLAAGTPHQRRTLAELLQHGTRTHRPPADAQRLEQSESRTTPPRPTHPTWQIAGPFPSSAALPAVASSRGRGR